MEDISITQSKILKPKTIVVIVGVIFLIVDLCLSTFFAGTSAGQILNLLFGLGLNLLMLFWCTYDSRERGVQLGRLFTFAVLIFGVFTLFYYFFKSRGFTSGLISIGKFVGLFAAVIIFAAITSAVVSTLIEHLR